MNIPNMSFDMRSRPSLLRLAAIIIGLMVLFPPYQVVESGPRGEVLVLQQGYGFLLSIPSHKRQAWGQVVETLGSIDVTKLAVQVVAVALCLGLLMLAADRRSMSDESCG